MKLVNFALSFGMIFLGFYILAIGKDFLLPLVIAIVFWYLSLTLASGYEKIKIKSFQMPHWGALLLSLITFFFFFWFIYSLIMTNTAGLMRDSFKYQDKFFSLVASIDAWLSNLYDLLNIEVADPPTLKSLIGDVNIPGLLSSMGTILLGLIKVIASYMGMILIYLIFLFLEHRTFDKKIAALTASKKGRKDAMELIEEIGKDINLYLTIKTLASFGTAMISYFVLQIIGVDFAAFWALLIFLLNYIPTVGSIIAVVFPFLFAFIQFDTVYPAFIVGILLVGIQFVMGNVVEPKMQGQSLNLSPLVIVLSLVFWGKIWGIAGAFLCVPIMVIINIILSRFPTTRPIAILLSANGKILSAGSKQKLSKMKTPA